MIIQACNVVTDTDQRQLQPQHGTLDFPCVAYRLVQRADSDENAIPWHWHEDFEMIRVTSGVLRAQLPGRTLRLRPGEILFLNANVPHMAVGDPVCELRSLAFSSGLIVGWEGSAFARRYLDPLTACAALDGFVLPDGCTAEFLAAFDAVEAGAFGFEFAVREHLSRICLELCRTHRQAIAAPAPAANQDAVRIRAMLNYIHAHYREDVTLAEIARAADVGERECLRCFRREIQTSPLQYLIKYRVTQGAALLRREGDRSIADISADCGFDSPSNFSQMFRRIFQCAPRDYRRQARGAADA